MRTSEPVVILGAKRTPHGKHGGSFSNIPAPELAACVVREFFERDAIRLKEHIDAVFMGEVLTAGVGQNPARQAVLRAHIPFTCGAETFNRVCSSPLAALWHAYNSLVLGEMRCVIAGGMENMSMAPHLLCPDGKSFSLHKNLAQLLENRQCVPQTEVTNSMLYDGLCDARENPGEDMVHMGFLADVCAEEHGISRKEQDDYAYKSCRRALASRDNPVLAAQIVPVTGKDGRVVSEDECVRVPDKKRMKEMEPYFREGGTVTAATSAQIADGAAALVLASYEKAKEFGQNPLACIVGFASASLHPKDYPIAPVAAIVKLLKKTGVPLERIDFFEINEAFATVPVHAIRSLRLSPEKVNVLGGSIALGHPIGATGARLVVNLTYLLREYRRQYGIAVTCNGGGEAVAVLIENIVEYSS